MPSIFSKPRQIKPLIKDLDDSWWPAVAPDDLPVPHDGIMAWQRDTPRINYIYYIKDGQIASMINHFPAKIYNRRGFLLEDAGNISIITHPRYRGQGYGTLLLKFIERTGLYIKPYDQQILSPSGARLIARVHPELD